MNLPPTSMVWCLLASLFAPGLPAAATTAEDTEAASAEAEEEAAAEPQETVEEILVVTASRTEQNLHQVPAAVTVLGADRIEEIPADDYGDILRNVPGLNVSQMSARDIQITGRGATNSLASTELVLLDGRTVYLDFFGFVMWDLLPVNTGEIKQVEVVRGPGSAVWGANAMTGVINLITKSPSEISGTTVLLGGGELGTAYGSVTHAGVKGKLGYKLSGGYYEQDPYDRPTGSIPGSAGPTNPGGTPYPPFENQGTAQPKFDLRFDYDAEGDSLWYFGGGYAGTDGIIHSGIGPFDIDSGTNMSYAKADWVRRSARVSFFANLLDGDAQNLLTVGPDGRPLSFAFESQTYNLDASDTRLLGDRNILTYGANFRQNEFDLSIAPQGDDRREYGVFVQDEILIGDKVRWLIGGRWDDIDPIDGVFSPRTSLLLSPRPNHTFRLSYNQAFRAPSLINNFLDVTILNQVTIPLSPIGPFVQVIFPTQVVGNVGLSEEQLDAYEVGYVGTLGRGTTFTLSLYRNETTDSIDFFPATFYSSQNPPPGWPLPPIILDLLALAGSPLPASFTYRNIGEIVDQGAELSLDIRPSPTWSFFFNYSYQDEPDVEGIEQVQLPNGTIVEAVNIPPENRINAGASYSRGRFFVNANVNYADDAFWTDVLDSRFWGPTDSYTMVNLGAGVRLRGDRVTLSVNGQNIFDEDAQQHVFGDLISRKVIGQVLFNL